MVDLDRFENSARSVRGDAPLNLAPDRKGVTTRTGRIARWVSNFRGSENRAVAAHFVVSLRKRFGAELTEQALHSTGLSRKLIDGKPLRARHVETIVERAKELRAEFRRSNTEVGIGFGSPAAVGSSVSMLQVKIDDAVKTRYPESPQIARFVGMDDLASRVRDAIVAAGKEGEHFVTVEEVQGIADSIVAEALETVHDERRNALARLSVDRPDSLSRGALSQAMANSELAGSFHPDRLSLDAKDLLAQRIREIVDNELPPSALTDESAPRGAIDRLMSEFVTARDGAGRAVQALPLDPPDKEALLNQVLHDNVPAALVPALGRAFVETRRDVAVLGQPLNAKELQEPLARINESVEKAFADSDTKVTPKNRHALYRGFWRCLLAATDDSGTRALAERFEHSGRPLRAIGEGANWYLHEFPHTRESQRILLPRERGLPGKPAFAMGSFRKAGEYSAMLSALADVLGERVGGNAGDVKLGARDTLSDEAIATMRNLGISMPASTRLGESNRTDFISEPAMAHIQNELDTHFNEMRDKPLRNGVVVKSYADLTRATYNIDGESLPRELDAVVDGLRNFCTDSDGGLDEEMLKCVSGMANQGTMLSVYTGCLEAEHPHLSVISGLPVVNGGMTYHFSRDEAGDVLLNVVKAGPVAVMVVQDENASAQPVELDPARSNLDIRARIRLAAPTWEPALENVAVDYSLIPARRGENS